MSNSWRRSSPGATCHSLNNSTCRSTLYRIRSGRAGPSGFRSRAARSRPKTRNRSARSRTARHGRRTAERAGSSGSSAAPRTCRQHAHVDQRAVVLLDRHGHMMVVRQQRPIGGGHFGGLDFREIAQALRRVVEQRDQRIQLGDDHGWGSRTRSSKAGGRAGECRMSNDERQKNDE